MKYNKSLSTRMHTPWCWRSLSIHRHKLCKRSTSKGEEESSNTTICSLYELYFTDHKEILCWRMALPVSEIWLIYASM
jgi:hypothetical protein